MKQERGMRRDRSDDVIPFDMLDVQQTMRAAEAAKKLERLYHQGQERSWVGTELLDELVQKHGAPSLPPEKANAMRQLLAVILWGELAAWKVSAILASRLEPLGAKMAATGQVHDEARHFYVMHDYLAHIGEVPKNLGRKTQAFLERVLRADNDAKLLLGMQLVVEPMAQTLFHLLRDNKPEPVLSELLPYYERDEARHVALGVLYLPVVLGRMNLAQKADLARWQLSLYLLQLDVLKELKGALAELGIDVREALRQGRRRQVTATRLVGDELGRQLALSESFLRLIDFKTELVFPREGSARSLKQRLKNAAWSATFGLEPSAS